MKIATKQKAALEIRWVVRPGDRPHLCGAAKIGPAWYFCEPLLEDDHALPPALAGYRLTNLDTGAAHDVDLRWRACDCPDYLYRHSRTGGLCKHLRALAEAGL